MQRQREAAPAGSSRPKRKGRAQPGPAEKKRRTRRSESESEFEEGDDTDESGREPRLSSGSGSTVPDSHSVDLGDTSVVPETEEEVGDTESDTGSVEF